MTPGYPHTKERSCQSLVGELKSHKPHGMAKTKQKNQKSGFGHLPNTIHKNLFKMTTNLKGKVKTVKLLEKEE